MKIAVCTPVYGDPKRAFVACLIALTNRETKSGTDIEWFNQPGSVIEKGRCDAAQEALDWGAEWLLWVDGDQTFPANTLERLLSHNEPIVGCNYSTRTEPPAPIATAIDRSPIFTTLEKAESGLVEPAGHLGFGCILTKAEVFRKLAYPWFTKPLENGCVMGEDNYFCREARKAGYEIWLDHALSWHIGHIGETIYTNAMTR